MEEDRVTVVIHRGSPTNGDPDYQVFTAEYKRDSHSIEKISKDYVCFDLIEEVEAFVKGFNGI